MLGRRFKINQIEMPGQMRETVLDQVRKVIENNSQTIQQTSELKMTLQNLYGGEWQVIISDSDISVYFSKNYIQNFIELKTESKTMLLFRRLRNQQPILQDKSNHDY